MNDSVLKYSLRDGNEQRATKRLEEHDTSSANGNVFKWKNGLDCYERCLEPDADAHTSKYLIAKPLSEGNGDGVCGNEACPYAEDDGSKDDERCVIAHHSDENSGNDGRQNSSEKEREDFNA